MVFIVFCILLLNSVVRFCVFGILMAEFCGCMLIYHLWLLKLLLNC